ncbi:MAG: accessory gene regulator B family protein [Anaerovoracaceae bacterium]
MQSKIKDRLINASVNALIQKKIIEKSEEELYFFGINQLYVFLLNIATTVVLGAICGMIWQSILFSVAYIPLRRYAGGYHAKTQGMCYCMSILLIVCVLMIIHFVSFEKIGLIIMLVLSFIIIFARAPVESENKALSTAENKIYRLKSRVILTIEVSCALLLFLLSKELAVCIIMAICCSAFMLIIPYKFSKNETHGS